MNRKVTRWISVVMACLMIVTAVPLQTLQVQGAVVTEQSDVEGVNENEVQEIDEENQSRDLELESTVEETVDQSESSEDSDNESETGDADEQETDETVEEAEQQETEQQEAEQQETEEISDEAESEEADKVVPALNYLFINEAEQEIGATQSIVVSWGDGSEPIETMELVLADEAGNEIVLLAERNADELFLFQHMFAEGIYHVARIEFEMNGQRYKFTMEELGIDANFGVGRSYSGNKSDYIEMESSGIEEEAEVSVVTIDEDGLTTAKDDIAEALQEADPNAGIATLDLGDEGNLVIVLDPGHDASHAGATGNGVHEEVATLKIAQYCKEELEKYSGVTVYLTRESAACPYPETVGMTNGNIEDIKKRVEWAKTKGADVFISIHLNSYEGNAKGAEVYYPDPNVYSSAISTEGKNLAARIEAELVALGLYERGIKANSGYAVITNSAANGFPGLIIEHAFVTSASDAGTYLKSDAGLKKLGVADANGIAKYYNLSTVKLIVKDGKTYAYNGTKQLFGEQKINGCWYHFDETTGAMTTGWCDLATKRVYYDSNGHMVYGERKIDGYWYYFHTTTGAMTTGWVNLATKRVYYDNNGHMLYGQQEIGGKIYYFHTTTGAMLTGWYTEGENKYYIDTNGQMVTGEKRIDGYWYHFDEATGVMTTGWCDLATKRVYYDDNGHIVYGERKIDGHWYYFHKVTGKMMTGWVDLGTKRVFYGSNGYMLYGKQKIDGEIYYFHTTTGAMMTGWCTIGTEKLYLSSDGTAVTGEKKIDGYWYHFDTTTGAMTTGWCDLATKRVYYDGNGHMVYGERKIDGYWYYFHTTTGAMTTGWVNLATKRVYYDVNGHMLYGAQVIDGTSYYFHETTGAMMRDVTYNGKYYDENGIGKLIINPTYKIMGKSEVTVEQMIAYFDDKGDAYPYTSEDFPEADAQSVKEFCQIYMEECEAEGVKAEVAFCQAMYETAFLEFTGRVPNTAYNFCGLGAIDSDTTAYATFDTIRLGIRAQVQHLKAYASTEELNQELVDPRFELITRGCAEYVEYLGAQENPAGKGWATSSGYGLTILSMINCLKTY